MSGLAAVFHRDGRPSEAAAAWAMLDAIPYRGPDGMWVRTWETGALGFAKMAVTPEEELEQQPLVSPRTGCAIIADVRLDNRADLLGKLPNRPLPTASDAELILRAYEAWDSDAPRHLLGDFAFIIWDPRRQRLVCARDTYGQRGLYFRVDRGTFAAASEIHQLFQDPSVSIIPNEEHIRNSLVPINVFRHEQDQASTFYNEIYALPAAHLLVVDREGVRTSRYWKFQPPAELRYRFDSEYADHYLSLFSDVVRARLRSSRPLGALLSGGLDSSAIVCIAHELYRSGLATSHGFMSFSTTYEGLDCDERQYVQDIQAKYGFDLHYLTEGPSDGRLHLEPGGFLESPSMGVQSSVGDGLDAACRAGVRVLFTGEIADSCVGGSWLVFDSLLRKGQLRSFWRYLRHYDRLSTESLIKTISLYSLAPLLPLSVQRLMMSADILRTARRQGQRWVPSWMPGSLRDALIRRNLDAYLDTERHRQFSNPTRHLEHHLLYPPPISRHPAPWPLQISRPFADRQLHEFLLAIPPEHKFVPHHESDEVYAGSKRLVRDALQGILPESVRTRTGKTIFSSALESELKRQWPLYESVFGPLARSEVARRGWIDQTQLWERLKELRNGVGTDRGDLVYALRIAELENWFRTFNLPREQLVTVQHARRGRKTAHPVAAASGD